MKITRREGPFVTKITGDVLSVHRCQTEEKWGVESKPLALFLCYLTQKPLFVVHCDGLYVQNAHDELIPL
jgi:hypothetical protein